MISTKVDGSIISPQNPPVDIFDRSPDEEIQTEQGMTTDLRPMDDEIMKQILGKDLPFSVGYKLAILGRTLLKQKKRCRVEIAITLKDLT
jgi:hypothetical protein